jgi:ABC-type transport system substrate-binding protein
MDYPDASDFFEPNFSSDAIADEDSQNFAFYSNPELDLLLKKAHRELDADARRAMYRRCEEIVRDDAPWAIGYHQRWYELVQPYVHDFVLDAKHSQDVRFVWIDAAARQRSARSGRAQGALALVRPWGRR